MKLYLLKPLKKRFWDDRSLGFVVAAKCEWDARRLAAEQRGDEGKGFWLEDAHSSCVEIAKKTHLPEGVVLRDFNAG